MQCKVRSKEGKKEGKKERRKEGKREIMKRDGMMEIWKYGTKTQKQGTKKRECKRNRNKQIKTKNKNAQSYKIKRCRVSHEKHVLSAFFATMI